MPPPRAGKAECFTAIKATPACATVAAQGDGETPNEVRLQIDSRGRGSFESHQDIVPSHPGHYHLACISLDTMSSSSTSVFIAPIMPAKSAIHLIQCSGQHLKRQVTPYLSFNSYSQYVDCKHYGVECNCLNPTALGGYSTQSTATRDCFFLSLFGGKYPT